MRRLHHGARFLALAVALPCAAHAQETLQPTRLSDLLGESLTLSVMPSYGWVSLGGRSAFDARLAWLGRSDREYTMQLGLELGAARFDLHSYVRSGFDVRLLRRTTVATWFGLAGSAGNGTGPRQMFQLSTGADAGLLSLGLRTTWLETTDTLAAAISAGRAPIVQRRYTDAEATATQRLGPISLAFTTGSRFGGGNSQQWAFAMLTLPVRDRLGVSFASGWRPEQPERAQPRGAFAQVSLRFDVRTTIESTPTLAVPAEEELTLTSAALQLGYRLRVNARTARTIELKGDLTDWEVREFHRATDGAWELEVGAKPGVYMINIRIDGQRWIVPTGLVAVSDSFGGMAGFLNLQ